MEQAQLNALRREIAVIEGRPMGFAGEGFGAFSSLRLNGHSHEDGNPVSSNPEGVVSESPLSRGRSDMGSSSGSNRLSLGVPDLDNQLGGGLPLAALHEIRCNETRETGALTGFAAALLTRLSNQQSKPILWIEEEMALNEAGLPFGGGIAGFGLDPNRLIIIRVRRAEDALWTLEEGLRCNGLGAVLAMIRASPQALDLTTSRRLALRASKHGVMGLLLRQAGTAEPGAATTRWQISARPAGLMHGFTEGVGRPSWRAVLEKSRLGPIGRFDLEWDHAQKRFDEPATTHSVPRPAVPFDRSDRQAGSRTELALKRAG